MVANREGAPCDDGDSETCYDTGWVVDEFCGIQITCYMSGVRSGSSTLVNMEELPDPSELRSQARRGGRVRRLLRTCQEVEFER